MNRWKLSDTKGLERGVLYKLLAIKPWETTKEAHPFLHPYLLILEIAVGFENGDECYFYLFCPTTSNLKHLNSSRLLIESYHWYKNKNVVIKLDEIFIISDFVLKRHIWLHNGENVQFRPQLLHESTFLEWRLNNEKVWKKIQIKLWENLRNNKSMFFVIDRNSFRKNSNYFKKKYGYDFVYNSNAFIPEYPNISKIDFLNTNEYVQIVKNIFNNFWTNQEIKMNSSLIENYKNEHFKTDKNDEKISRYNKYFEKFI